MSNIGMHDTLAATDDFALIRYEGSGFAEIVDDEGEFVLNVPAEEIDGVAACMETIGAIYRQAYVRGIRVGKSQAQCEMQKALGL